MAKTKTIRAAVLGASGYTGADMIRLAALHPAIEITALIAKGHAGQSLAQVFPHLASLDLPALVSPDQVDWDEVDVVFCGLPHGTAHSEIGKLPKRIKIIDMSADFRLRDPKAYAAVVRQRAQRAGADQGRRLRAHRALSRQDQKRAARRLSRLLSDRRAARASAARQGEADRNLATSSSTPSPACRARAAA